MLPSNLRTVGGLITSRGPLQKLSMLLPSPELLKRVRMHHFITTIDAFGWGTSFQDKGGGQSQVYRLHGSSDHRSARLPHYYLRRSLSTDKVNDDARPTSISQPRPAFGSRRWVLTRWRRAVGAHTGRRSGFAGTVSSVSYQGNLASVYGGITPGLTLIVSRRRSTRRSTRHTRSLLFSRRSSSRSSSRASSRSSSRASSTAHDDGPDIAAPT